MKIGFDNDKYLKLQSENILKRVNKFGDKLYIEFGGKLFDDYHASRVLPGFLPDSKLRMLLTLKEKVEIVIAINAKDIQKNKMRGDIGINYQSEVLRLIDAFRESGLFVGSVCITQYQNAPVVDQFREQLKNLGIKSYLHYEIKGYPHDVDYIISEDGFGKNEYIETTHPIVVVTAPGPGSGKMATCLSQLYHENKRGIKAGYAKYETFPIWNLALKDPVNVAYEAATADLQDINMIDPYHLDAHGVTTINYNRDIEIFPVVKAIFEKIYGSSPYESPTDMGVNMAGYAISDHTVTDKASCDEIIRRYYDAKVQFRLGRFSEEAVNKIEILMKQLNISTNDRPCVKAALHKKEITDGNEAMALELEDGRIIDAKTSDLLTAPAALILNTLKALAGLDDKALLLPRSVIEPVSKMKTKDLGNHNPRLHADEILIALAISANSKTNEQAKLAIAQLPNMAHLQAHSTVILPLQDADVFKKLKVDVTTEDTSRQHRLYVK